MTDASNYDYLFKVGWLLLLLPRISPLLLYGSFIVLGGYLNDAAEEAP
jgi:hypothetical protein